MTELAINGGPSVFGGVRADSFAPKWPIPFPETEQKLIDIYRSSLWSGCRTYEQQLMAAFAKWQGAKYAVCMSNGTTTLETSLIALGIGPGDEVIVPGVSWIATAETPLYIGATTVMVDIDPETLCIDPDKIEEAITPRTKAIIPVHLFSAVSDMDRINAIAKKHNLYVIEDCAHAHGAKQHGVGVGAIGDVGSFSFQLSKLMTSGEGGICISNTEEYADRIMRASHIGSSKITPDGKAPLGMLCHQYRMTEFQAAIILDQLAHQDELKAKRTASFKKLEKLLANTPGIRLQKSSYADDERAFYFLCTLLQFEELKPGLDRDAIMKALEAEGVFLNIGWGYPIYGMPSWNVPESRYIRKQTPICDDVMYKRELVCSGSMLLVEDDILNKFAEAINKVMTAYAR